MYKFQGTKTTTALKSEIFLFNQKITFEEFELIKMDESDPVRLLKPLKQV